MLPKNYRTKVPRKFQVLVIPLPHLVHRSVNDEKRNEKIDAVEFIAANRLNRHVCPPLPPPPPPPAALAAGDHPVAVVS